MPYTDRFALVEDYIVHLDPIMAGLADPFIQSRYLGFVLISAVTVYELAIKDIFYAFSDTKHKVLGNVARGHFDHINGRIKLNTLKNDHVKLFGEKYRIKFDANLEKTEDIFLRSSGASIKSSYGNVVSWRHSFVHGGTAPTTTNYSEIKRSYFAGKEVIHCLNASMVR